MLIVLAWMLLLDEAVRLNMSQEHIDPGTKSANENGSVSESSVKNEMDEDQGIGTDQEPPKETETALTPIPPNEKKIRVLLMDTGYQSYFHSSVTVLYGDTEVTYTPESQELSDSPFLIPEQEGGITVASIERQEGNPVYRGSVEIQKTQEGLLLINELPLETYLESVVPSEMPSTYEMEALKAQAVCARTYAYRQMQESRLQEYGADVDDSVRFQVYANIAPRENTTDAVRATAGQVLRQKGELIQAYYFSTSSGATSTDEIWGASEAASYLKAVPCKFDSGEPWSAWKVTIPWETLSVRCDGYPLERILENTEDEDSVRGLRALEITRINQSKAVTGLHVVTSEGSFDLMEEYAIREFLSPKGCMITEKDGTVTEGGSLLPSAYFTMETIPGDSVIIEGRGYGHGVGMSQTAANQMALEGYTSEEILNYFFNDVEIEKME